MGMKRVAGRRGFIKQTAAMTAGLAGFGMLPEIAAAAPDTGVNIIGPKPAAVKVHHCGQDTSRSFGPDNTDEEIVVCRYNDAPVFDV